MVDFQKLMHGIREYMTEQVAPLNARIAELESRNLSLEEIASKAAALIPAPENGKDAVLPDIELIVSEAVVKAVSAMPVPKDGKDGVDGKDGTNGIDGKSVLIEDVRRDIESHFSKWALDFERQAHDVVQRSIDRMPKPKDGIDAIGFDDLDVIHDGIGNVTLRFANGTKVKEFDIRLPVILDHGIFRDGNQYSKGNGVSHGGCFYIAQVDDPQGRPGASEDWRMAVKKGRDAK